MWIRDQQAFILNFRLEGKSIDSVFDKVDEYEELKSRVMDSSKDDKKFQKMLVSRKLIPVFMQFMNCLKISIILNIQS